MTPATESAPDLSYIAEQLRPLAVPCDSLVLDPANARLHPTENLEVIKGSLRSFGQVKPVVVRQETGVVVCGNGTLAAARALGWTHVAATVKSMDAATATALGIADNRSSDLSAFDTEVLEKLMQDLVTGDPALDKMLVDLAAETGIVPAEGEEEPTAPEEFTEYGEDIETDHCCPKCGYKWSGKQA